MKSTTSPIGVRGISGQELTEGVNNQIQVNRRQQQKTHRRSLERYLPPTRGEESHIDNKMEF